MMQGSHMDHDSSIRTDLLKRHHVIAETPFPKGIQMCPDMLKYIEGKQHMKELPIPTCLSWLNSHWLTYAIKPNGHHLMTG